MSFQRISQGAVFITGVSSGAVLWASSWWACFGCSPSGQAVHRAAIPMWESEKAPEGDNGEAGGGVGGDSDSIYSEKDSSQKLAPGEQHPLLRYCAKTWVLIGYFFAREMSPFRPN